MKQKLRHYHQNAYPEAATAVAVATPTAATTATATTATAATTAPASAAAATTAATSTAAAASSTAAASAAATATAESRHGAFVFGIHLYSRPVIWGGSRGSHDPPPPPVTTKLKIDPRYILQNPPYCKNLQLKIKKNPRGHAP